MASPCPFNATEIDPRRQCAAASSARIKCQQVLSGRVEHTSKDAYQPAVAVGDGYLNNLPTRKGHAHVQAISDRVGVAVHDPVARLGQACMLFLANCRFPQVSAVAPAVDAHVVGQSSETWPQRRSGKAGIFPVVV